MIPQSTTLRSPLSTATTQESWAVCALVGAGSGFGAVRDTSTGRLPPRVLGLTTSPRPQPVSGDRRPASLLYTLGIRSDGSPRAVRGRGEEEEDGEDSALKSFRPVRQDQPRLGRRRPMRAWQVFGCVGRAQNSGRIIPWWISCTMIESNENDRGWGGGRWSMFLIRICTTFHDSEWGWAGLGWDGPGRWWARAIILDSDLVIPWSRGQSITVWTHCCQREWVVDDSSPVIYFMSRFTRDMASWSPGDNK